MTRILRRLQDAEFVEFTDLFSVDEGLPVLVVTFIAVLELARETLIRISQEQAYAPIYVKLGSAVTEGGAQARGLGAQTCGFVHGRPFLGERSAKRAASKKRATAAAGCETGRSRGHGGAGRR